MKKRYQIIFLGIALALLFYLLRKVGITSVLGILRTLKWYYIAGAFALNLSVFLIWTYKWKLLVDKVNKVKIKEIFPILMAANFVNTTTPTASLGGEPLKAYYLSKKYKKEKTMYIATVIIDKAINLITSLAFSLASIIIVSIFLEIPKILKVALDSMIIIMGIAVIIFVSRRKIKVKKLAGWAYFLFKKKFKNKEKFISYLDEKTSNITKILKQTYRDKKSLRKEIGLGVIMQILTFSKPYILFLSFGQAVNPLYIILAVSISMLIGQIVIIPGGIGVVETMMIGIYTALGIDPGIAATVAILDRMIYYIFTLGVGYISLTYINYKYQ